MEWSELVNMFIAIKARTVMTCFGKNDSSIQAMYIRVHVLKHL